MGDFWIKSASVKVDGESVADGQQLKVDQAVKQTAEVKWNIGNTIGGWQIWTGCATAYDLTNGKQLSWGKSAADFQDGLGTENLNLGVITKPTKIRINVMATQRDYAVARQPELALWKNRK